MSVCEYCVVHFIESDDVEVAPSNWIEDKICYWPPYKLQKIIKAVKQGETPDKKTWDKFQIRVLHKCKEYSTARNKLKKAEDTSDLNTELEEHIGKGKRKHQPSYRRLYHVSSSEEESDNEQWDEIPPLPPVPNRSLSIRSPSPSASSVRTNDRNRQPSNGESILANKIANKDGGEKEFQYQVLRALNVIKARQEQQTQVLDTILEHLVTRHKHNAEGTEEISFPSELLPLRTESDLEEMEKLLENPPFKKKFAIKLSSIGGNNLAEVCRRILQRTITDQLAENFSWFGTKGKRIFSNLNLADVIQEAVRLNDRIKIATDRDIQTAIMGWLRHAKERSKHQKKKEEGQQNQEFQN